MRRLRTYRVILSLLIAALLLLIISFLSPKRTTRRNVHFTDIGLLSTLEEVKVRIHGIRRYSFNVLVSDRIGQRQIADQRPRSCRNQHHAPVTLRASVVICFYNEAFSALVRTVQSVVDQTPRRLLSEIILIDDCSDDEDTFTFEHLSRNLGSARHHQLRTIRLLRNSKREGLIRSRLRGARLATAKALVFLDSHSEVTPGWLEALLVPIGCVRFNGSTFVWGNCAQDGRTITFPMVDVIDAHTFEYRPAPLVRGTFSWSLAFRWEALPSSTPAHRPIPSPTMPGGLFAVDRSFFHALGEFDPALDTWGGENVELSFRAWMCGARVLLVPCSRVGHVFRAVRPYGDATDDTYARNVLRVARIWLADQPKFWSKFYHEFGKTWPQRLDHGNVTDRLTLRRQLGCRNFSWYYSRFYPHAPVSLQHGAPAAVAASRSNHSLQLSASATGSFLISPADQPTHCFSAKEPHQYSKFHFSACQSIYPSSLKVFRLLVGGQLVLFGTELCLTVTTIASGLFLDRCDMNLSLQRWRWLQQNLYSPAVGQCLTASAPGALTRLALCALSSRIDLIPWTA